MAEKTLFHEKFENVSTIANGAYLTVPISDTDRKDFSPFNRITAVSDADENFDIILLPSGKTLFLASGGDGEIDDEDFSGVLLYNRGSTTAGANEIIIYVQKIEQYTPKRAG